MNTLMNETQSAFSMLKITPLSFREEDPLISLSSSDEAQVKCKQVIYFHSVLFSFAVVIMYYMDHSNVANIFLS